MLLTAVIGGGGSVFIKFALKAIPPFTFTFIRFFLAFLVISPFVYKSRHSFNFRDKKVFLISSLLVLNVVFFSFGIRLTTATISVVLYTATPIIAGILSYFILGEKIGLRKAVGISLGLIGVIFLIILPKSDQNISIVSNFWGNTLILIAVVSFALFSVLSKRYLGKSSPLQFVFIYSLLTVVFLFPLFIVETSLDPTWIKLVTPEVVFITLIVAIVCTVGFYFLYQYIIMKSSPLTASMSQYLQPATAYFWASILLGEKLTVELILGAIIIFVAVWLTTKK